MANAAHLLCSDEGEPRHVAEGIHRSGPWALPEADVKALVGGRIHLHVATTAPSFMGGMLQGYTATSDGRIELLFKAASPCCGQAWRGSGEGIWSGLVQD